MRNEFETTSGTTAAPGRLALALIVAPAFALLSGLAAAERQGDVPDTAQGAEERAGDAGRQRVERFLTGSERLKGEFRQTLIGPDGRVVERAAGELAIAKPGRFRWHYTTPGAEQLVVADGERLWLYDVELEQVTVKSQGEGISGSPAALLGGDERALEAFVYEGSYRADGLDWVQFTPRDTQTDFTALRLGFEGERLAVMELRDALEQITRIEFTALERNPELAATTFEFAPPAGVDVIGALELAPAGESGL